MRLVEQGSTHTGAARRLCVSIKFVNDMVRLKRETGSLVPKPQGNPGRGLSALMADVGSTMADAETPVATEAPRPADRQVPIERLSNHQR